MQKKWWFFHGMDFQTLMYPCFTFCRILGMFPYKINASTFEISKPHYILSTLIICVYCVFYLLYIHGTINSEIITFEDVEDIFLNVYFLTFNGLIAIVTHILSNPRMRLLQSISEIYSNLPSESRQMLSRFIQTKDILGIILLVMEALFYFAKMFEMDCWEFLIIALEVYVDMLGFEMNMLYMNCICVLKTYFKKINDDLIHMQSLIINDMKQSVPSLTCHIRKNQIFLIVVKTLMKQHLMINETVQKLNLIFNLQVLATVMLILCGITFELYLNVVNWQGGIHIHFDRHSLNEFLLTIVHYILKITLIVWACETCKNQAQEISTTISNVLNATRDEQIKSELKLFSLQILHHKNTFLMKGLTMDATLLTTVMGKITMYMLLLTQFLIASHSCDRKLIHK